MKVIVYTLNNGEVPEHVTDGGYFLKGQTLVGIANDNAPENAIATKTELQNYAKTLTAPTTLDGENPTITDLVNNWWAEKVTW